MNNSKKLRWKMKAAPKGQAAIAGPRSHVLHDGKKRYAEVSCLRSGKWYWVAGFDSGGPHQYTCDKPADTADEAKAQAMAYIKRHLSTQKGD
ncbi:hypothetical protein P5704_027285 (plasmid) [Pseudomonas sp. FeN3W]|nr:hypothetical protein P5704_027285 [Pseudomonas sp. FeN3W]